MEGVAFDDKEDVGGGIKDAENPSNDWLGSRCVEALGIKVMVDSR